MDGSSHRPVPSNLHLGAIDAVIGQCRRHLLEQRAALRDQHRIGSRVGNRLGRIGDIAGRRIVARHIGHAPAQRRQHRSRKRAAI